MNYNQQPGSGGPGQQQPPMNPQQSQGQQPQQQGRPGNVLTAQMLANLTPQQLQAFKNHPQFHEIVRAYTQRQQLAALQQQQQAGNRPPMSQQSTPQMQQQMTREQMLKQQQILMNQRIQQQQHQKGPPGQMGIPPSGIPPQQQAQMPYRQQPPPQPAPGPGINQLSPQMVPGGRIPPNMAMINKQLPPGARLPNQPGGGPIGVGPPPMAGNIPIGTGIPPVMGAPGSGGPNPIMEHPGVMSGGPGVGSIGGATPIQQPPIMGATPIITSSLAPQFPPEVLSKIPMKTLTSFHEWSDKLRSEGKSVPYDVKVYESMIKKDSQFISKLNQQTRENKITLENFNKDIQAYNHIKQLRMNSINLSNKGQYNNSIWGEGYQGYANGITNTSTKLYLPQRDLTDRMINERVMKYSKKPKHYVPIRLDFDQERDRFKLRDTFLWDLNEEGMSVESFVKQLLEDYKFIPKGYFDIIATTIKEQISDYSKKPLKTMGEIRVPIKLDITINNTQLTDQFEWDILNCNEHDPEEFAMVMTDELCLPGEFTTAIAHTIREQMQFYHKALNLVGYNYDGAPVHEDEIRNHLLPSLRLVSKNYEVVDDFFSILRNPTNVADFSPSLIKLTQLEVERLEKEIERESRRKRRHNLLEENQPTIVSGRGITSRRIAAHAGRGGPTLPDLTDLPKTFRTPAPSSILPGAVDLGVPEVYEYNEIYINRTQVRNPDYKPPTPEYSSEGERVSYDHDPILGNLFVTIKLPRRR
ncbi:SNF5 [[Candida] subhashii]|uniref:SNF5 n=1 Tax=[Candida] subhashii TaxID=561895 RepID=A0A8J5UVC9_9ASCO|nr:SNF5 [[Candida] subhashii]KAG7666437.1 SNF5 [[Candida] subhashii]